MTRKNKFDRYYHLFNKFVQENYTLPNFAKTKELLKVSSLSTVHRFYQQLVSKWYVDYIDGKYYISRLSWTYDVYESVQAGFPSPATDELKTQINLQDHLIRKPLSTILVKVTGDSMVDAGIHPNDTVIVEKWSNYQEGDIVVAVIDGDYTLKYLAKNDAWYYLKPANHNYCDIIPENELEVFGLVVWSFRTYWV